MKRKNITTNNKEIYTKFNLLNFSNEIVLKNVKSIQIEKIVENINSHGSILLLEKKNKEFVIKKIGPINYNIYLKK